MAGHVWPARGAGGADAWQEATRTVHVGARVGRHVAGEDVMWRAHGYSGPWLDFRGGNAISVNRPLIYRGEFIFFLPCGTMFHTDLIRGDVAAHVWPTQETHRARQMAGRPRATWAPAWGATCRGAERLIKIVNRGKFSPIYPQCFPSFNPCGTMFPHDFCFPGDVATR